MKKILALLVLLSLPAVAAQGTTESSATFTGVRGSMDTTNDTVRLNVTGNQWATVKFTVGLGGAATVTTQITTDGTNYFPAPYSRRLNVVSANPTVQAIAATTLVTGDVWETPIPGDTVAFQITCAGSGSLTTVTISGGRPYVVGVPVAAVLADVTEASIGAGVAAFTQDTVGWSNVLVMGGSPTGVVWSIRQLDDAGSNISGVAVTFTAAAGGAATLSHFGGNTTSATVGGSAQSTYGNLTRRMAWSLPAGGTVSQGRIRIEAFR